MPAHEFARGRGQKGAHAGRCEIGERPARIRPVDPAVEHLHADLEYVGVVPVAADVELLLEIVDFVERLLEVGGEPVAAGVEVERGGLQHAFEHDRVTAEPVREPGGASHDLGEQPEQGRVVGEQGKDVNPGRERPQEVVETEQRGVRVVGRRQGLQHGRDELGQELARPRAAGRAVAAVMPDADTLGDPAGFPEAQPRQGFQRLRIVLRAGEDQVSRTRQIGGLFEQDGVMRFDGAQLLQQRRLEARPAVIPHEKRDAFQLRLVLRQGMGLLIVDHLQAVLDPAVKPVGPDQPVAHDRFEQPRLGERAQRIAGVLDPQRGIAPAPDELLGLGEELDLPDAAPAELDVVPGDFHRRAAALGVDLALDRMDVLDGEEIEALAPDERTQHFEKRFPRHDVSGDRAGLDHRRPFPVLAGALVIDFGRPGGDRDRRGSRIGAQPQIGAEDIAVAGAFGHHLDEALGETDHALLKAGPAGVLDQRAVIEHDQVDIA